jgi:hypothetical protein
MAPKRAELGSVLPVHAQAWEAAPRRSACISMLILWKNIFSEKYLTCILFVFKFGYI